MSYELMDNIKYKNIEQLLEIMESDSNDSLALKKQKTFGASVGSFYKHQSSINRGESSES
jgi:hypothetical protein